MDRRVFLKTTAGASIAVLFPGGAVSATVAASDPWAAWKPEALRAHEDFRVRAIAHAILAPNPQNLQPWTCELTTDGGVILRFEGDRRIPASDGPDRQLTVGFGAFAELLTLAAEADGYGVRIELFPEGEPWPTLDRRPVATFAFEKASPRRDPLLDHLQARHTNRTPFDPGRVVTAEQLEALRSAARKPEYVGSNTAASLVERVQGVTLRAWDAWIALSPNREEVARWTKIGNAAIAAAPYGPAVPDAALAKAAGPVTFETLSDPTSAQFLANRAGYRKAVLTGRAHVWVFSPAFDRKGMFDAGRDWVRLHLQAKALGLDMQPHSQAIQDVPELEPYLREIHEALGVPPPGRIQMLGRVGYGSAIGPSPRLPATAHLAG